MLQLWTESDMPLVPEQAMKLRNLFEAFREQARSGLSESVSEEPFSPNANVAQGVAWRSRG